MKINGTEIKGIKKAVGRYNSAKKQLDNPVVMIIFDNMTNTIECASVKWYFNNQERMPNGYFRYDDISDLLIDVYGSDCEPTMANIQAVLREYVI